MKGFPKTIATKADLLNCLAMAQATPPAFPVSELAAAIERHEKQERNLSSVQVYDLNQRLDFTDEELPNAEDIIPMDLSEPKVFGEEDYNAFVQSAELF